MAKRVSALLVILSLGACVAPESPSVARSVAPSGRDCVDMGLVTGYQALDRDTIRLNAGPGADYDVDLVGAQCNTVEWTQRLAIESTPSSWVCVGSQLGQGRIYFRDTTLNRRVSCYIGEVRRVTPPTATPPHG